MMIFDSFPNRLQAERFAADIQQRFQLKTAIFDDADTAYMSDRFPSSYRRLSFTLGEHWMTENNPASRP